MFLNKAFSYPPGLLQIPYAISSVVKDCDISQALRDRTLKHLFRLGHSNTQLCIRY